MSTEPWEGPLTDKERVMIDEAWERHKAAAPKLDPLVDTSIDALLDLHRILVEGVVDRETASRQVEAARAHLVKEILRSEFEVRSGDNALRGPLTELCEEAKDSLFNATPRQSFSEAIERAERALGYKLLRPNADA